MCKDAAGLGSSLDAEQWASHLLGMLWEHRFDVPPDLATRYTLALGAPLLDAVAPLGGVGARIALTAIQKLEGGPLGKRAGDLVAELGDADEAVPDWLDAVGDAEVVRTAVIRDEVFDDGLTVFIEARRDGEEPHVIGVYIDHDLGGIAKHVVLLHSLDRMEDRRRRGEVLWRTAGPLEPIEPGVAAGHVEAAIALTDLMLGPPVGESYARLRALALRRVGAIAGPHVEPSRPEVSDAERERLRNEFLSSPEGRGFDPDGDRAYVASVAIDFASDYVNGRPLRWSPVVVELFMFHWSPHDLLDGELFEKVPAALDAWVRFAGRKAGMPDWAIEEIREAIPRSYHQVIEQGAEA